jgi:hypothetical protein
MTLSIWVKKQLGNVKSFYVCSENAYTPSVPKRMMVFWHSKLYQKNNILGFKSYAYITWCGSWTCILKSNSSRAPTWVPTKKVGAQRKKRSPAKPLLHPYHCSHPLLPPSSPFSCGCVGSPLPLFIRWLVVAPRARLGGAPTSSRAELLCRAVATTPLSKLARAAPLPTGSRRRRARPALE